MEARPKIKKASALDDAFNDILGDSQKPVTPTPTKGAKPQKAKSVLDDAFDDIVKKKDGTQDSGTGVSQSGTTVSESKSTTPEQNPSTTKSEERPTPFNSLTLTSEQLQNQLDASLKKRDLVDEPKPKVSSVDFLHNDINSHAPNIFEEIAKTADRVAPKLSDFDRNEIAKQTTKDVFYSPGAMAEYTKQRVNTLRKEIDNLEKKKLKSSEVPVSVGTGTFVIPSSADKEGFEKSNKQIAEKQAYIDSLKNSVAELASERIVSQSDLKNLNPKDLGRKIIEIADPELDQQFKLAEKGGNLAGIRKAQMEQLGINAVKSYLKKYPDTPNAKQALQTVQDMEHSFDERNIEATAARVRNKLGKFFYDEGKSGVFGYSQESLKEAINSPKTNLTPSEKKIAETYVLPVEKRIWGTDIPGSGFARSFRNAIEKTAEGTVKSVEDITGLRDESDIARDVLNQPANTRYAPIQGRSFWQETRDGIGDLTGQVAMMALATKGVGSIGKALTASGAEGGLLGGMTRTVAGQTLSNSNVGLFLNSFLNSYDNHYQEAVATMPGKDQGAARKAYATTMATIEGLSEKIFNDTKILKAFSKEAAPAVRDITKRYLNNEITSSVAREEMQGALKKAITPFVKEYGKSTVEEGSEEAVVDLAQGVAQSVFGGTPFDIAKTGQQAVNTFLTTALYSPLVAGLAASGAGRKNRAQNAFMKSAIGQMAANPGEYLQQVDNLVESGEITTEQANEKRKLISSASNILKEIPESRLVEPDKNDKTGLPEDVEFTPEETTSYIVHRLNEQIIEQKLDNTTDPVLTSALNKDLKRSVEIRKGIYDGYINVNEDLQEVAPDAEVAEELNIVNPESVSKIKAEEVSNEADNITGTPHEDGGFVTLVYKESEVPDELKDKVSSKVGNMVWFNMPKAEADKILNSSEKTVVEDESLVESDTKPSVLMPDEFKTPEAITIAPKEFTPEPQKRNVSIVLPGQLKKPEIIEAIAEMPPITAPASAPEETQPFATVNNETKEFTTKSGNQKVIRENGKLSVVNVADGKPASPTMHRKAIREYANNYDYSIGEKAAEPDENADYKNEQELMRDMVDKSSHPAELAAIYMNEEKVPPPLSPVEQLILDNGQFNVKESSYNEFGDRNNMNNSKARSYIRKDGKPLDVIAADISADSGLEVTPADIVEFMDRFPNGFEQADRLSDSEVAQEAAAKFYDLTGLELTPEIAAIAVDQDFSRIEDINKELLNQAYETGRNITDAYSESIKKPAAAPIKSESKVTTPAREVGKEDNATKPKSEPAAQTVKEEVKEEPKKEPKEEPKKEEKKEEKEEPKKEQKPKGIAATGKDLAAKARKFKYTPDQLETNLFGLPIAVYNGLIETIATAIEGGAVLAEAIQTGFNSLSKEDRSNLDEKGFKKQLQDFVETQTEEEEADVRKRVGISHTETEKTRQEQGLGDQYEKTTVTDAEIEAQADAAIKEGYNIEKLILKIQNGTQPSALETVILGKYQAGLVADIEKNPSKENLEKLNNFRKAVDSIGTIQGRAFRLRQRLDVIDDSLAGYFMQEMDFNGGVEMTPAQQKASEEEYKKITEAKKAFEAELEKVKAENQKLKTERGERRIREISSKAKSKKTDADFKKERERIIKEMNAAWQKANDKSKGKLQAVILPYAAQLYAIDPYITKLAKSFVDQGVTKLSDLVDHLHSALVPFIPQITKEDVMDLLVGDYKQKKQPKPLSAKAIALKDIYIELKKERAIRLIKQKYDLRTNKEKIRDLGLEIINVPRSLMSSVDFSAPLRQAVIPTVAHPVMAAKAGLEMFKQAFSQKRFDRWFYDYKDSPRYKLAQMAGLYVADPHDIRLGVKEESFMNNLAEKIPIAGPLVKGSERAYVGYLNKMRVDLFNRAVDSLENDGKTFDTHPEVYTALASVINNTTGRGNLGKLESAAPVLNSAFFAPRYTASILNILGLSDAAAGFGLWGNGYYGKMPKEIRKQALLDVAKFIGAGLSVMSLLALRYKDDDDFSIELDPRSSDFGKIKIGNTRWNIWGSYQPTIRYLTQIITGQTKSGKTGKIQELDGTGPFGRTRGSVMLQYLRSKFAPVPSMIADVASGTNAIGEPVTWQMELENHVTPLFYQDLTDAYEDKGVKSLFTVGLPSAFGISVQTQQPRNFKGVDKKDPVFKFLYDKNVNLPDKYQQGTMTDKEYKAFEEQKREIFKDEWEQVIKNGALFNEEGKPTVSTNSGVSIKDASKLTDEELSNLMKAISARSTTQAKKNLGIETKKE